MENLTVVAMILCYYKAKFLIKLMMRLLLAMFYVAYLKPKINLTDEEKRVHLIYAILDQCKVFCNIFSLTLPPSRSSRGRV